MIKSIFWQCKYSFNVRMWNILAAVVIHPEFCCCLFNRSPFELCLLRIRTPRQSAFINILIAS
jgi:membrane protein CcdC involved in cytochrome C biogenesis